MKRTDSYTTQEAVAKDIKSRVEKDKIKSWINYFKDKLSRK